MLSKWYQKGINIYSVCKYTYLKRYDKEKTVKITKRMC